MPGAGLYTPFMFNLTTASIFTALFLATACGGRVTDTAASDLSEPTPQVCDREQAESQLIEELNAAYFAHGDLCQAGRDTCLDPAESCDACQAIYCCDTIDECMISGDCSKKDSCMFQYCPVCSKPGVTHE